MSLNASIIILHRTCYRMQNPLNQTGKPGAWVICSGVHGTYDYWDRFNRDIDYRYPTASE